MRKKFKLPAYMSVSIMAVMLAGCVMSIPPEDYRVFPHQGVEEPTAKQAQVIILWEPTLFLKDSLALPVYQDYKMVGVLKQRTYFSRTVVPGRHVFSMHRDEWPRLFFTALPGRIYFIMYRSGLGYRREASLQLIPEDQARAWLPDYSTIEWLNHAAQ